MEEVLRNMIEDGDHRFWGLLGCKYLGYDGERVRLAMTAGQQHTNSMGIIHGGVLTSLMDQAMGMAALALRPQGACVTTNLNVHFLSAMKEGELIITARVVHEGGRTLTTEAEIRDSADTLGAMATATFRSIPQSRLQEKG